LEAQMKRLLQQDGATRVVAQCPEPASDKLTAVNGQIDAEAYNKRLGNPLHAVPPQDFPLR
jgi:hypothetical protein